MRKDPSTRPRVSIVGAGFTGLSAGYELARAGVEVTILEADATVGGLAAAFDVGDTKLERFYHIWYTNDYDVLDLVNELGLKERLLTSPTNAGVYYANRFFKLSSPIDLLKFRALPFFDRLRLGLLLSRARRVKDWSSLEHTTAHDWLRRLGGENVYRVVWQPLLRGKFGEYAEDISAVWFWNKLALRSTSRGRIGEERFAYLRGGFTVLAEAMAVAIRKLGGRVELNAPACSIVPSPTGGWITTTPNEVVESEYVIATPALPVYANLIRGWAGHDYIQRLERIRYIGNVCLVLELDRSLTTSYWVSVNDPGFPFVGLIEHTNLAAPTAYGGRHIVYLSKYMPTADPLFSLPSSELLDYSFPYLKRMFPTMERSWIKAHHLWRAHWSQPIIERNYGALRPPAEGPQDGLYVCTMAQIYPEDRGTNYAIRAGRSLARRIVERIRCKARRLPSTASRAAV